MYRGRGGDPTEVHIHSPPSRSAIMDILGTIAFAVVIVLIFIVIVIAIKTYKNANQVTAVAVATAPVAVPPSSTTSTGTVDTVITGSATVPGYYITSGGPAFTAPPTLMGSTPSAGSYGWSQYVGSIDFTAGYWAVTINNLISIDSTSQYVPNATGSNLSNYQMLLALNPNMTTIPDSSAPYSFATDGPYLINGSSEISSAGDITQNTEGTGGIYGACNANANTTGSVYLFTAGYYSASMPTFTTYVNVPSDVTYYIFNVALFSTPSTTVTSYNQCPFISSVAWNATRLSNTVPEENMPYSSYFAPATASASGTSGTSGAKAGASTANTANTFMNHGGHYSHGHRGYY